MTAQRLRVLASVHREHLPKQGGCRPVGQQSGELRPQPIQLRSRAGVWRPLHACPGRAAASTAEAGQPDRDLAEQRGDRVLAIVLYAANARATPAPRPPHGVVPCLRGDDLPLDAPQHQLRFGQGQTQIGDVDEPIGPANLYDVRARPLAFRPDFHQPQNPSHVSTLGQRTSAEYPTAVAPPISRRSRHSVADRPATRAACTGMRDQRRQTLQAATAEMRLDPAKSARFSGSVASNDRPVASILAAGTIYDYPNPPKGRSWPRNRGESGECRLRNGRNETADDDLLSL